MSIERFIVQQEAEVIRLLDRMDRASPKQLRTFKKQLAALRTAIAKARTPRLQMQPAPSWHVEFNHKKGRQLSWLKN